MADEQSSKDDVRGELPERSGGGGAATATAPRPGRGNGFFTIYKKGQGYWTRMGTALAAALLAVLFAHFVYTQMSAYVLVDTHKWPTTDAGNSEAAALMSRLDAALDTNKLDEARGYLDRLTPMRDQLAAEWKGELDTLKASYDARKAGTNVPSRSKGTLKYIDTSICVSVAAAVMLVILFFAWRAMNKPSNADFLIATDSEMKKVNWTTRQELVGSTLVVIVFVILVSLFLFVLDVIFGYFFQLIKVLQFGPFG